MRAASSAQRAVWYVYLENSPLHIPPELLNVLSGAELAGRTSGRGNTQVNVDARPYLNRSAASPQPAQVWLYAQLAVQSWLHPCVGEVVTRLLLWSLTRVVTVSIEYTTEEQVCGNRATVRRLWRRIVVESHSLSFRHVAVARRSNLQSAERSAVPVVMATFRVHAAWIVLVTLLGKCS